MDRRIRKTERLCSQKAIGELFKSGKVLKQFPFKVVYTYCPYNQSPAKIVISVPKKIHKRAVKRNFIRRRIKEAYRLNKHLLYDAIEQGITLNVMFIYVSPNISNYAEIEKKLIQTLSVLAGRIPKDRDLRPDSSD
jgi:ribonuclease P protein component